MTIALIDDQLLGAVLRHETPRSIRSASLHTTGCWYFRLCQAVLGGESRTGTLSSRFQDLSPTMLDRAVAALVELPTGIGLLSFRELAPAMADVRRRHSLDLLSAEVVAAAKQLDARVFLSVASPALEVALLSEGVDVRLL